MNNLIKQITYLALLFIMMPLFKPTTINFNYSDALFCVSFILIIIFKNKETEFNIFNNYLSSIIYYLGILLFFLGFGISSIINGSNLDFLVISSQYLMLLIVLPLVLRNSGVKIKKSIYIVLISMIITILFGIYIYFFTSDIRSYSIGGRVGSLFKNPNTLSKNIALLAPLSFILIYIYNQKKVWLFIPFFSFGLMIASSFGGIIASLSGILVFFIISKKITGLINLVAVLTVASLLFISLFGLPEIFEDRILGTQNNLELEEMGSFSSKTELMENSLKSISENPFIGVGLGNYVDNEIGQSTVHNSYLLIWSEGGLLSLFGFLLILISFLTKIISKHINKVYFATSISIYLVMLLNFITNVHFYNRYTLITMFLLIILFDKGEINESENSTHTLQG